MSTGMKVLFQKKNTLMLKGNLVLQLFDRWDAKQHFRLLWRYLPPDTLWHWLLRHFTFAGFTHRVLLSMHAADWLRSWNGCLSLCLTKTKNGEMKLLCEIRCTPGQALPGPANLLQAWQWRTGAWCTQSNFIPVFLFLSRIFFLLPNIFTPIHTWHRCFIVFLESLTIGSVLNYKDILKVEK